MSILEWFTPTRWIILLALLASLMAAVLGYGEVRYNAGVKAQKQTDQLAVDKLKTEAAETLGAQTRKVLALERALADAKAQLEIDYEKRRMDSKAASVVLDAAAARNGGRLFDPHAGGCRSSGGGTESAPAASAGGGEGAGAQAGGLLSVQLSDLLRGRLQEADAVNDAYAICRADSIMLRQKVNGGGESGADD